MLSTATLKSSLQQILTSIKNCGVNWRHLLAEIFILVGLCLSLLHFIDVFYATKQSEQADALNSQIMSVNKDLSSKLKAESSLISNIKIGTASVTNVYNVTKNTLTVDKTQKDDTLIQLTALWNSRR